MAHIKCVALPGESSRYFCEEGHRRLPEPPVRFSHDGAARRLEPKSNDWRPAAMDRLPKQTSKPFEGGRVLLKEAKGLGRG